MDAQYTGNIIAEKRKEMGLTQKDVAERLHVSISAVSKWERGLNFPDLSLMEPLSELLGITTPELLGIENTPTEEVVRSITTISVRERKNNSKMLKKTILALAIGASVVLIVTYLASLLACYFEGSYEKMTPIYVVGYICYPATVAFTLISVLYAVRSSGYRFMYFSFASFSCYLLMECISQLTTMSYASDYTSIGSWEVFLRHGLPFALCLGTIVINLITVLLHRKYK